MKKRILAAMMSVIALWIWDARLFAGEPQPTPKLSAEYKAGKTAALRDFEKGLVNYTIYGLPGPNMDEFRRLAKERYRINVVLGGCCPLPKTDHDRGYEETVQAEWKKRYAVNPLEKLSKEMAEKQAQ